MLPLRATEDRMWKGVSLVATVLGVCGSASAQDFSFGVFYSGRDLAQYCQDDGFCNGYVAGIIDAFAAASPSRMQDLCIPRGASVGQLVQIVRNYVNAHPENWHYSAASFVYVAVAEAFPCPQ
jgi:hypothetical protein